MTEITQWTACETARALTAKKVSVTEVTHAHLARMDAVEPDLNAVVDRFPEQALAQARELDEAGPDPDAALWGLPITVKINIDMAGLPSSNGIPALKDNVVEVDGTVAANIKAAKPVILGRSNAPEFSLRWFTSNPLYGETRNPLDASLTPGGSSGGAAAAVAAGVGVMGHGNDLGGSLRNPAYSCGLVTLRPSMGRIPAYNPSATERPMTTLMMSVQGMIARSVEDIHLALDPMSKRSPLDPLWTNAPNSGRARSDQLRIGVARDPLGDGVAPEVSLAIDAAVDAARAAGALVAEQPLPMIAEAAQTWGELLVAETEHMMFDAIRQYGSAEVIRTLEGYRDHFGLVDIVGFMAAQARRQTILRAWNEMFETVDAVIMPVSSDLPYAADQDFRQPNTLDAILRGHRILYAINVLGLPAAVIPTVKTSPVPLGVQVVSAWRDDALCLDIAGMIERELDLGIRP
jgi:amidase